jgi:hypothetical protein
MTYYPRLSVTTPISLEYLNNHVPQKVVKEVLKKFGISDQVISLVDWNKSRFPGVAFEQACPRLKNVWDWPTYDTPFMSSLKRNRV